MKLDGYHVFYTYPSVSAQVYEPIHLLVQLTSVLHWKFHFGAMHLYCDQAHLEKLKQYGIDQLYDSINTEILDDMPRLDQRYWAFSKIHVARKLLETQPAIAIIDTDLWVNEIPDTFDPDAAFQGLHQELFDEDSVYTPYVNPMYFLPSNWINEEDELLPEHVLTVDDELWTRILPINCAFSYFSDLELVNRWHGLCLKIIDHNKAGSDYGMSREMVFLEQRLLPTLGAAMGKTIKTLLPVAFNTCATDWESPWVPAFDSDAEAKRYAGMIKHLWGRKQQLQEKNIRKMVLDTIIEDLSANFASTELEPFQPLITLCQTL